jgi:DNA-binding GntR family transcriptional regulator
VQPGQQLERGVYIHERVYQRLRDMIVDGDLEAGDRLVETDLARTLGVSRTPVREAIRRLLQENWVDMQEFGGVCVRQLTEKDLVDAYRARAALESLAARLACERITPQTLRMLDEIVAGEFDALGRRDLQRTTRLNTDFHESLARLCGNRPLLDALQVLSIHTVHYKRAILRAAAADAAWQDQYETHALGRIRDHARIVELLKSDDADALESHVRQHVLETASSLVDLLDLHKKGSAQTPAFPN